MTQVYANEPGFSSSAPDDPGAPPGKDVPAQAPAAPAAQTTTPSRPAKASSRKAEKVRSPKRVTPPCPTPPPKGSTVEAGGLSSLNSSSHRQSGHSAPAPSTSCNRSESLISWRLTQKYFFDPTFGGAIVTSRRNIFETTLSLSGVAFLTEPRNISPLVSRLRVRTSAHTDLEWDFDLDTGAKKFTSSNVYLDLHQGQYFSALSYARLDAPGRFFTQDPDTSTATTGVSSAVSDFNQLRFLIGYGNPTKPGLSLAANTGLDLKSPLRHHQRHHRRRRHHQHHRLPRAAAIRQRTNQPTTSTAAASRSSTASSS